MPVNERTPSPSLGLPRGPLSGSWFPFPAFGRFPAHLVRRFGFSWGFPLPPLFLRLVIGYPF
jgi:hypothetical protein